jgi:hypothetical protein
MANSAEKVRIGLIVAGASGHVNPTASTGGISRGIGDRVCPDDTRFRC